jgi:hypothetical protein
MMYSCSYAPVRYVYNGHVQAYFRAAKAALDLKEFEQARSVCQQGIEKQPDFPELAGILEVGMTVAAATTSHHTCCVPL